ncbi:XRE family transcriptional regulator [Parasphingorhabdus sp. JC815]|uniref:helix-turn-helix domain-containing protein n=1 Tax=Parasphingorhabdus sp. JC815 TaxID=3232140 RepID=UPI00345A510B
MLEIYTDTVCLATAKYTTPAIPDEVIYLDNAAMAYSDNIKRLRKSANFTQSKLAEMLNVEQPTIQRWESGKREPSISDLELIAKTFGVTLSDLFANVPIRALGPTLYVKGAVAAGQWVEAYEWHEDDWQSFTGRADVTADVGHRFGLQVKGDSMDEIYPDGTIVECVSLFGNAEPMPGKKVVVVRRKFDQTIEATVKELVEIDGALWLRPRSSNPVHQSICLQDDNGEIEETRIVAVVVASVRPE